MKTEVIKINPKNPNEKIIKSVAKIMKNGGIVVYPTETCYGLGTNAIDIKAIKKLRKIKDRELSKPISIIVSSLNMMSRYGKINRRIRCLVKKFMPGPLTIITHKKKTIPNILNQKEIAFRIPSHPVALMLVKTAGVPITTPSANPKNLHPAYIAKKALEYFDGKIDVILDAGKLRKIKPSTMIDLKSKEPKLVRKGPIQFEKILKACLKSARSH